MSETSNFADCLIISSKEGKVNKMTPNFSRSIIAVYFLPCFYCHFLNRVTVRQGDFRKNTNNQVQNWQSNQRFFAKQPHNHYLIMKTFSCQSRRSATKYFSCIVIRKIVFQDLLEHLFKNLRATTRFQVFMKPSWGGLSNLYLTYFNNFILYQRQSWRYKRSQFYLNPSQIFQLNPISYSICSSKMKFSANRKEEGQIRGT